MENTLIVHTCRCIKIVAENILRERLLQIAEVSNYCLLLFAIDADAFCIQKGTNCNGHDTSHKTTVQTPSNRVVVMHAQLDVWLGHVIRLEHTFLSTYTTK